MSYLKRDLVSHTQKVLSLYKRMRRDCDFEFTEAFDARFKRLLIRREFDKYKNLKDMRKAKAILQKAEQDFAKNMQPEHYEGPAFLPFSKDGISYRRVQESPDTVMDYYHPLEKSIFPYFFAKREKMKDEYLKIWNEKVLKRSVPEEDQLGGVKQIKDK